MKKLPLFLLLSVIIFPNIHLLAQESEVMVSTDVRLYGWAPMARSVVVSEGSRRVTKREPVTYFYKTGGNYKAIEVKDGVTGARFHYEGPETFIMYQKKGQKKYVPVARAKMQPESKDIIMLVLFVPGGEIFKQLTCLNVDQKNLKGGQMLFFNIARKEIAFKIGKEFGAKIGFHGQGLYDSTSMPMPGVQLQASFQKGNRWKVFRSVFVRKPDPNKAMLVIFYPYKDAETTKYSFHMVPVEM